jgi:hypothetical protein
MITLNINAALVAQTRENAALHCNHLVTIKTAIGAVFCGSLRRRHPALRVPLRIVLECVLDLFLRHVIFDP